MTGHFQAHWFGDYELIRPLGEGGMAEVFLARTIGAQGFEKIVVVKRLLPRLQRDPRIVDMFVAEAKVAVQLQHANIVQILGLEEVEGRPCIIMEYVRGRDLFNVLAEAHADRADLPVDFAIHCLSEMLKGLGYAHAARGANGKPLHIVHRDVTPSNIFISFDGEVKLGDFGVAHVSGQSDATALRGKYGYLAPELLRGEQLDGRADLFSAGVVLWESLAHQRLFLGASEGEILQQVAHRTPEPPSTHNPRVPPDLDRIAQQALAKDPKQRFQTAEAFEEALADFLFARRLRWSRRRIVDVMQARYPQASQPMQLPPVTPRAMPASVEADFEEVEPTQRMAVALGGLAATPTNPFDNQIDSSNTQWPESLESQIVKLSSADRIALAARRQQERQLLVYRRGQEHPTPTRLDAVIQQLVDRPREVAALGAIGEQRIAVPELGRLLFWDTLGERALPTTGAAMEATGADMSLTHLIYELTVRRTSGLVVIEGGAGNWVRQIYLDKGFPLYVTSDAPGDGAPVRIHRHQLVDELSLHQAMAQVIEERKPLDQALAAVAGEGGDRRTARLMSTLLRSRLYAAFTWESVRFRVFPTQPPPVQLAAPIPHLLGILVRAVSRAMTTEMLVARLEGRGERAVVVAQGREPHVAALRLKPFEQAVFEGIDGRRNVQQIMAKAGANNAEKRLAALAVLYVLGETRIAELV